MSTIDLIVSALCLFILGFVARDLLDDVKIPAEVEAIVSAGLKKWNSL